MILELFAVLVVVAVAAVFLGYYSGEWAYALIGLAFLFLIGVVVLGTGISYSAGSSVVASLDGTSMVAQTVYDSLDAGVSHFFGYFLCVAAVGGFALLFMNFRAARAKSEDDF